MRLSRGSFPGVDSERFDQVPGTRFGSVRWVSEIGSTNTELLELGRTDASEGAVLIADLQTAGRGRRGRQWTAPPGTSLMMSVLLRPPDHALQLRQASLVTSAFACAAAAACVALVGVEPGLKWPNDLVVEVAADRRVESDQGYRKLAGILTESVLAEGRISALVVGMGMNTGWGTVPPELDGIATSLDVLCGSAVDRPTLAAEILKGFDIRYSTLLGGGTAAILDEARRRSVTIGRSVRIALTQDRVLEGVATDIDTEGHLLVTDGDGTPHVVSVGDVVRLRPTDS